MANAPRRVRFFSSVCRRLSSSEIPCLVLWTLGQTAHQIADETSGVGTIFKLDLDNDLAKVGGEAWQGIKLAAKPAWMGGADCWPQGSRAGKPHATSDEPQLINRSFDAVSMYGLFVAQTSHDSLQQKLSSPGFPQHPTHQDARNAFSPKSALISLPRFPGAGPGGPVLTSRWRQHGLDARVETLKRSVES